MKVICPLLVSEEYQIQQMLLKSLFLQQLSFCCNGGYSLILTQAEENRNTVTLSENPVLYADSLKKLAFSSNVPKIPALRSCLVFSPGLCLNSPFVNDVASLIR